MRPLLEVYVDAGCDVVGQSVRRSLAAREIDILRDAGGLEDGGVLLLGARTSDGAPALAALREMRRRTPHVLVFACASGSSHIQRELPRLAVAGLDQFFIVGSPADEADLVTVVSDRVLAPPPARALQALAALGLEPLHLRVAMHAYRNSQRATSMTDVARRFGRSLRTVEGWCDAPALPNMADLFRCGRYLHLVELEHRGVQSVTERAGRLGFATETNLRQWIWRLRRTIRESPKLQGFASRFDDLAPLLSQDDPLERQG